MQWLWCWRCKCDMPMLDEREFAKVSALHYECRQELKEYRRERGATLEEALESNPFQPVRAKYLELTGMNVGNVNAIMHHRLSLYGLPCKRCGKPLRTPKAKLCGACMHPVV